MSLTLPGARAGRDPARAIKRGPSRLPPEVVAATQRERLFDGLVHTVAQKGYANARVSDICQAAGVTRPVFYALFAGKEEALLATYRHGTEVLLRMMDEAYRAGPDWRTGVRAALHVLLDVLAAVPAFAAVAIVEMDGAGPAARGARDTLLDSFHRFFDGAPVRSGTAPRRELIHAVVGGLHSTIYRYVAAGRTADLAGMLPILAYVALVPFVGHDEAARELRAGGEAATVTAPCVPRDRHAAGR